MKNNSITLGIAEIVLNVNDITESKHFYQEVLGLEVAMELNREDPPNPDPEAPPTIVFLALQRSDTPLGKHGHAVQLALIDYRRHAAAKERFKHLDLAQSPLNHVAFEIRPHEYETQAARLESLGLPPGRVEFPHIQAKALFFGDPDGNTLEFICHDED